MENIPEVGKEYNCFDDGKIRCSRLYTVKVEATIPFEEGKSDEDMFKQWEEEVKNCYWLYKETTDYFIISENSDGEKETFVRTKNDRWFSMGFLSSGLLDVDGSLTKQMAENCSVCPKKII